MYFTNCTLLKLMNQPWSNFRASLVINELPLRHSSHFVLFNSRVSWPSAHAPHVSQPSSLEEIHKVIIPSHCKNALKGLPPPFPFTILNLNVI